MEKNHQLNHELHLLLGPIPQNLGEKIQFELNESWANYHFGSPHSIKERTKNEQDKVGSEPMSYTSIFLGFVLIPVIFSLILGHTLFGILMIPSYFVFLVVLEHIQRGQLVRKGEAKLQERATFIRTSIPSPNFTLRFITSRGSYIIDSHITDYHNNIHKIQIHKNRLYADLREAQRLYSGDHNNPLFLTIHTTLISQMSQIDTHVQLLSDSIVRLEDFKDALYKKIHVITTQQEQLTLFEKVMQESEHTNEMLVQMETQQQIAAQELQESFKILLHMIHDIEYYIEAKKEIEERTMDVQLQLEKTKR